MTYGGLFEGIGMFAYAAQQAGIEPVWSNEIDPWCCEVLNQNFNHKIICQDVKDFTPPTPVDVICGGFPCQDITNAGTGAGIYGQKSGLWTEMYRIIAAVRPGYVLIENSFNLRKKGLEKILCDLADIGYDAEWQTISASSFGCSHQRKRIYLLAYPCIQRRRGHIYTVYQRRQKSYFEAKQQELDTIRNSFLQFSESTGEPPVFRVDDENTRQLDATEAARRKQFRHRLSACGNAIVWEIAYEILKEAMPHIYQ